MRPLSRNVVFATFIATGAWALTGCNLGGAPMECVCQCDGVVAGAGQVQASGTALAEATGAAKPDDGKAEATPKAAKPTPAPAAPAAAPAPARPRPAGARRAGPTGAAPGSGTPMNLSDADKAQIATVWKGFAKGAKAEDVTAMQKFSTERFASSLARAMEKHKERLYRGLKKSIDATATGISIKSAGDIGDGNVDVALEFGDGFVDNVMFFKEDGNWKINRL